MTTQISTLKYSGSEYIKPIFDKYSFDYVSYQDIYDYMIKNYIITYRDAVQEMIQKNLLNINQRARLYHSKIDNLACQYTIDHKDNYTKEVNCRFCPLEINPYPCRQIQKQIKQLFNDYKEYWFYLNNDDIKRRYTDYDLTKILAELKPLLIKIKHYPVKKYIKYEKDNILF